MRIAIIDLGTNSVRFDVHQVGEKGRMKTLHREKLMVRLGQGVFLNGRLDREAVSRTLHAFSRFNRVAKQLRVDKMVAYGTSALREVSDREKFIESVRTKCGIELRTLSGEEEARLIALGILAHEKLPKGKFALVDIGGGSTEISICRGKEILFARSFPLGTARLQQVFLRKSPPDAKQIAELRVLIRNTILQEALAARWPKVERVIGSAGTIRTIGKILQANEPANQIDRSSLKVLNESMAQMTTTELLGISGMESRRVDMILAGSVLFEETMSVLGAKKALVTEYSLRDGLIEEERRLIKGHQKSHLGLHMEELRAKAVSFGGVPEHLQRVEKLAIDLFAKLRSVHRLEKHWLPYLQSAVLLRDVGEHVSVSKHEEHSAYIVKHSDLAPLEKWEVELLSELCKHHEDRKLVLKDLPFPKHPARRARFMRLLSLLRIVDALDPGPETRVSLVGVRVKPREVTLQIRGARLTGMEAYLLEARGSLFKDLFGKTVHLARS